MNTQDDRENQQITLADGRRLGYAEYGLPDGKPIFFFHGFPGSRRDWLLFGSADSSPEVKARIIVPDRPGMGLSDFQKDRKFLDWPSDVIELADVLEIDEFAVLAVSGGGPYGAVCAYKIPDRLTATAIVSGMGPPDAPGAKKGESWIYPGKPSLIRKVMLKFVTLGFRDPDRMVAQVKGSFSGSDAALMEEHPELAATIVASWQIAFADGIGGVHHDAGMYSRPWGFSLGEIAVPVHLWHGGAGDRNVLSSVGHYVADTIPNCQATFLEDESHFSLVFNYIEEILTVLIG